MNAREIELAVSDWIGVRTHLIVPNVSWGLWLHECDLLAISKSGYATEIEIKVSVSDLRRDAHKAHAHRSNRIRYLYFALPEEMREHVFEVPAKAGVILVSDAWHCQLVKRPVPNKFAQKFTETDLFQLARLGTLRMWKLKREAYESSPVADYSI